MLRKFNLILVIFVLLMSCTTEHNPSPESQDISQSEQVTGAEIAAPPAESYGTVEVIGGDEQILREFIQRWFAPMYAASIPLVDDNTTTITLGALPEDLAVDFPLPETSEIFASVKNPYDLQIMLDVPTESEDWMAAYAQSLEGAGWLLVPEHTQSGGFVSSMESWTVFCDEQTKYALLLQSYPKADQETKLRITVYDQDTNYVCEPQSAGYLDQETIKLPVLETPPGALVISGGTSSGGGTAESSSDIRTDLTSGEIHAHFSGQMETADWNRLDGGDADNFSWSSWATTDSQGDLWDGLLIVINNPVDPDLMYAMIRVTKVSK